MTTLIRPAAEFDSAPQPSPVPTGEGIYFVGRFPGVALADSLVPGYYLSPRWGFGSAFASLRRDKSASCKFVKFASNTPPIVKKDCYLSFIGGI
jgi:hypothetical protein